MKTATFNFKNSLLILALCITALLCAFLSVGTNSVYAYVYSTSSSISLTNGDFTNFTTEENGSPYSLTDKNWSVSRTGSTIAGVIDTTSSVFENNNKFGLNENPSVHDTISNADPYIFMFKVSSSGTGRAQSDSVILDKDTFYDISVHAKNQDNGQGKIVFTLGEADYSLPVVSSNWSTYHLLVATDLYNSENLSITLYINKDTSSTSGATFFDHITIDEITNRDFFSTANSSYLKKADLYSARNLNADDNFTNADFSLGMSGWKNKSSVSSGNYNVGVYSKSQINSMIENAFNLPHKNYSDAYQYNDGNALLLINNDSVTSIVASTEDNLLSIAQHGYFKLSLLVKTGELSSQSFKTTLSPINNELSPLTLTQSSFTSSKDSLNGFSTLDFYIKGSVLKSEKVSIEMFIDSDSGYAIVDKISFLPITQSEYFSASDSSKLDLSTEIKDTSTIKNGRFDFTDNDSITISYPLSPENWDFVGSVNKSGIIRINPSVFDQDSRSYGNPVNPNVNDKIYSNASATNNFENVLMLRNDSNEDIYYLSEQKTLSSKADTTKFSIGVKTLGDAKAFVKLIDATGNIIATIDNINTANEWEMKYIYIQNGLSETKVRLMIGMEGKGNNQYVFYDCARMDTEEYEGDTQNSIFVNLLKNGFTSKTSKTTLNTSNLKIYEMNGMSIYSSQNADETIYGVTDIRENTSLRVPSSSEDGYLLVIDNEDASYNLLSTDYTYSLNASSYYEISVYVKTNFDNATLNGEKYGAYIELVNLDDDGNIKQNSENTNVFSNIITSSRDNNGYVKYSFYVLSEESQKVKVLLGLGNEENLTQGLVFYDELNVTDITKDEYASQSNDSHTIVSSVVKISDDEDDPPAPSKEDSGVNIFALLSSIILVLALALAIAGVIIRRRVENKPKKQKKTKTKPNYHRTPTEVDKRNVSKELGEIRNDSLSDLKRRSEELEEKINELNHEYEETVEGKDDVLNQDKYKEYIKKYNKLNEEKEYLDSAMAYLKSEMNVKIAERKEYKRRQKKAKIQQENNDK